jgi:uncharacterized protein YgiM (DUF1202 family)
MKKLIALLTLAIASFAFAGSKTETSTVIRVKSGGATVYKSEASDEGDKLADIGAGDEVTLLKKSKARSLIKTSGSIKGWVDNSTIEQVKVSSGGAHNLKDVEVVGWLDNPSAVYILDNSNPDVNALPLDRNFSNEIVEKKDREEVERTYDEN